MSVVFNPGDKVEMVRQNDDAPNDVLNGEIWRDGYNVLRVKIPGIYAASQQSIQYWEESDFEVSVVPSTPTPTLLPKGWYLSPYQEIWWLQDNGYCTQPNVPGRVHQSELRYIAKFTRIDTRESWRASWANEIADTLDGISLLWFERDTIPRGELVAWLREFGGAVVDE